MEHRQIKLFLILGLLFFIGGCATTKITGSWKDPAFSTSKITNVVVIGVAERDGARRLFEDEYVKQLQEKNISAVASYTMFSLDKAKNNRATIRAQMEQKGIDTVIVTRLIDKSTEQKYYPPTTNYVGPPGAYRGGWYGYYNMSYSYYSSPGYTTSYDILKLECNVFDLAKEKLVYSALSDTTISRSAETEITNIIKVLVKNILSE